jgi:hypothetical protein
LNKTENCDPYSLHCCQLSQGFSYVCQKIRPLRNNSAPVGKPHSAELKIKKFHR